ncbi:hypothetical protein Catovirus_1_742 [Catovirus CTV1]|uniref:Uncharacterized protein n=1 Tax=Catovirus CTV1 TaxID=1977631 RepID=A0A1V0SAF4_9VIRU|nr:hypothetical protein Catovirus_1_742 [Catovirus CTV1]
MTTLTPKKLAIYYGYPSLVNGSAGDVNSAVNVFKDYDMIIFGSGLEEISHADHNKTCNIISNILTTNVFGYIDSTISIHNFKNRVDKWLKMGVKGIFADKFGYDFSVSRSKQNQILDYIHSKSIIAFVNAWNPDDVFSSSVNVTYNPNGSPSVINSDDWYLAQSYQIINGVHQNVNDWKSKSDKMKNYKQVFGTKMACCTTYDISQFDQKKMDYAYFSTILYGFDAFCFGENNFSATNSLLPYRTRKQFYGSTFITDINSNSGIYKRNVNVGLFLNTNSHVIDTIILN